MKVRSTLFLRVFIISGLLLQLAGSLPLKRAAAAPVEAGQASFAAQGELNDEPPPLLPTEEPLAAPPPFALERSLEAPPQLEPAGEYYAMPYTDPGTDEINTDVGGTIAADTTWNLAGSPYIVTSNLTVAAGATLTIEPGVVVNAYQGISFMVNGTLLANGTSGARITFAGTSASPGYWSGIYLEGSPGSPLSGTSLSYVDLRDGGYYNSRPANLYLYYASATLSNVTISNGRYSGVYSNEQGVAHISNSTISNNGTSSPEVDYAIWFQDGDVAPDLSDLTLSGNSADAIAFGAGTLSTRTWRSLGYPYFFTGSQVLPAGATLTVEPGVTARFGQAVSLMINGTLLADGSAASPITFEGSSATVGHWSGIYLEGTSGSPLSGSLLDYVTVRDGGYYGSRPGNLHLYYASATVSNATLTNGQYNGVYGGSGGVAHISNSTISNNGTASPQEDFAIRFADGSVAPDLSSLTLSGNNLDAIAFGQGTLSTRTWRNLGYPYIFTGSQTLPAGATLSVEAGVTARFGQGVSMMVNGTLLAQGTSTAPIVFSGRNETPGYWSGIYLEGTSLDPLSGSTLSYVTIRDGGYFVSRPANLYLYHAAASLDHSTLSNSKYNGVYGGTGGVAHLSNTTLSDNGTSSPEKDFAIWFTDGAVSPELSRLTLNGNSLDGVAFGQGTLSTRTWRNLGVPYYLTGSQTVPAGAILSVEPGVTVIADGNQRILVSGRLEAVGGPGAEITFTSSDPTPGAWQGLSFLGAVGQLATGALDYTILEYGGGCGTCANLRTYYAQVNITHSQIRHSSTAGVLASSQSAAGISISASSFTGNATYGVQNSDATGFIVASNNWWGHASGPSTPTNTCNVSGTGQAITDRVAFQPFLTAEGEVGDEIPVSQVMSLSLNPRRYYAPADSQTRVWFEMTLRDGAGMPISGQVVRLRSNLGVSFDGGTTDVAGKVFAYLTSSAPGEALVYAELDEATSCDFMRSATTEITFTEAVDDPLTPDARSPYATDRVEFEPRPVTVGVPGVIRVRLTNPNDFPIRVNASFGFAQLGLGLAFGPVGEVNDMLIAANSDGILEVNWTPLVSGKFCIRVDYTWEAADPNRQGPSTMAESASAQDASTQGASERIGGTERVDFFGSSQSNDNGRPGPLLREFDKNAIRRASVATTSLGDISFAAAGLDDIAATGAPAASAPAGFLQGLMVSNILDFIFEGGGGIDCAMDGGTSCGGWQGPRMHYPGESMGNLANDPPSMDYKQLVPLETLTFEPLQPSAEIPAARAAAVNELIRSGLDLTSLLTAAAVTYDRYAGAVEANEFGYATQQASAFDHYLTQSALKMNELADKMDTLVAELNSEGLKFLLAEQDFIEYQQRLATEGFNAQEIQAARMVGKDDEGIALSLQRRLALDPAAVSGWFDVKMTEAAQAFRDLSFALLWEPPFGGSTGSAGRVAAGSMLLEETPNLVRTGEAEFSFEVGNPHAVETTIDLRVRRIDLPTDWVILISQESLTLGPGEQATVTARAIPGLPGVQGTLPRFAVEGLANGELVGGVEFSVYLPEYVPFLGSDLVYLPLLQTKP